MSKVDVGFCIAKVDSKYPINKLGLHLLFNLRFYMRTKSREIYWHLPWFVTGRHTEIAAFLLSNRANPNSADRNGERPLHLAAWNNQVDVAKILLLVGMSPKTKKSKNSPIFIAEHLGDNSDQTPLQWACQHGNTQLISLFLDYIDESDACRCLFWSVHSAKPQAVEAILKIGKAPVNVLVGGITALAGAANLIEPALIELLLRYGANPNIRMESEYDLDYDSIAKAKIKFRSQSENGPTAMHFLAGIDGDCGLWGHEEQGEEMKWNHRLELWSLALFLEIFTKSSNLFLGRPLPISNLRLKSFITSY